MVRELIWDSAFFGRKMGELIPVSREPSYLKNDLDNAKEERFEYVICKLKSQDTSFIMMLESMGFYLTDIGVILSVESDKFVQKVPSVISRKEKRVETPALNHIPMLRKMAKGLFPESRFYNDPFFSKKEGDRLYQEWIENSVKGEAADVVFWMPETGFITCRKTTGKGGEIVLLGIKKDLRGKGFGAALVRTAMHWFREQRIKNVTVRTQLKNLRALKFYVKLGFIPREYDIILGKML
jgi:ribosomal protein S18 acetylase RimI-like enzyme